MRETDVIVLGGGTAGATAAAVARQTGARVIMFNEGELGGLCILRGCMPSKTMLHAAHLAHHARVSGTPGVQLAGAEIDFAAVMANKDAKVARFKQRKLQKMQQGDYEIIDARARFDGPDTVEARGEIYRFTRGAVIATGSTPIMPPIPGLDRVPSMTSDDVMRLTEQPDSLLVLGSGPVGLELGQFFARMGTRVTLYSRRRALAWADPLVADELEHVLAEEPDFELLQPQLPVAFEPDDGGVCARHQDGGHRTAERLLVAAGRRPLLDDLGLQAAGVEVVNGRLVCGEDMRTSNARVFAAGDATGERLILHVANWEGRVAGLNAAGVPGTHRVEQRLHLEVIFTDPPVALLGMSRQEAERQGIAVISADQRLAQTGRAITQDLGHGICQLLAERSRGEIIGAQIIGPHADEWIHVLAGIMYYHGTAADMLQMPWYHPTHSEVLLDLARRLAAQVA